MTPDKRYDRIHQLTEALQPVQHSLAGFARAILSRGGPVAVQDVHDVMADAYLTAATRLQNEDLDIQNPVGWYRRILFFSCLQYGRKHRRHQQTFYEQLKRDDELLDAVAEPLDLRAALQQAIKGLKETDQTIVRLAATGHTSEEIADELGGELDAATVRKRKSRALADLRKALGGVETWAI